MSRGGNEAYEAAHRAACEIAEDVIAGILEDIKAGQVDEDTLSDRIHEACGDALTYVSDQWICAYGLPNDGDAIEDGSCKPSNFDQVLAAQAFLNLRTYVANHDYSDAFAVAEDAALEETPEEPRDEVTP